MATNKITLVEQLDASKDFLNMKVKIIRRWINQIKRLEMVLVDEKGAKIQCTVKKELVPIFDEQIKEDAAVIIKRFGVGQNDDPFPVVKHKLKCNFYKSTEVQHGVTFTYSGYGFSFCPFNEITVTKARDKDTLNIDVIGCVSWCGNMEVFKSASQTTRKINMELKDLDGRTQRCTLWNDYAVQFNEFLEKNKSEEHVIAIMQHAVMNEWKVQTDKFGTRIFINEDIQEVNDFRRSGRTQRCTLWNDYAVQFNEFLEKNKSEEHVIAIMQHAVMNEWKVQTDKFGTRIFINEDIQEVNDFRRSGRTQRCTLWNDYAVQFNEFLEKNKSEEHVIAIMQHAVMNEWKVQTDKFGTRIFINEDIQEVNDFRRRLILKEGVHEASHTTLASQTVYPNRLDFILNTDKKQLDEVRDSDETGEFVVVATIAMLEQEFGWFFVGCRKDGKKVLSKMDYLEIADEDELTDELINAPADSLWCRKEKAIATEVVPKFRVTMRVQDSTGSASFVMWDRDVQKLLGLSANDIRQRQLNNNDDEAYPHELEGLLNVKVAFKIKIDKYNLKHKGSAYTVNKMCDDPDIIAELEEQLDNNEEVNRPAIPEVATVKLGEESQGAPDSKDAFSVTGDSLATEIEKDTETSPLQKRANETPGVESTNKVGKRIRKAKIYDD